MFLGQSTNKSNNKEYPEFSNGLWEEYRGNLRSIYHGGVMRGYSSLMYLVPEYDLGFYVAYNRDFETGPNTKLKEILTNYLMERWFFKAIFNVPKQNEIASIDTEKFEGIYANNLYCHLCYEGEGAQRRLFTVESDSIGRIKLWNETFLAISNNEFVSSTGSMIIKFTFIENGIVKHFQTTENPEVYEFITDKLVEEIEKYTPDSEESHIPLRAMTYRVNQDWDKAILSYQQVVDKRPNDGIAWFYLGESFKASGKSENAKEAIQKAFDLGKWKPWAAYSLADLYALEGNSEKAILWLKISVENGFSPSQIQNNPNFKFISENGAFKDIISD